MKKRLIFGLLLLASSGAAAQGTLFGADRLHELWDGPTRMENSLWVENPPERKFGEGRTRVVIADIKGPGVITMIHFALPAAMKLNRDAVLRMWWDTERSPSVQAPLVDFFCDPNGALERVDSVLVNKKRGWNCYFPMPFRKSARIELESANPRYPNGSWSQNPCYAYVMWRPLKSLPANTGLFHAEWRQKSVTLSREEYVAMEARGEGQFVGWNVAVRPAGDKIGGYHVDENEKFYIDGESEPSIEFQGLEDSFGFSWGFPEAANSFALTGYQPFYGNGAAAFRFFLNDRITFGRSLKVTIGFGKAEMETWSKIVPDDGHAMQFSTVCYWYQTEPHSNFAPIAPISQRLPSRISTSQSSEPSEPGETVYLTCGNPDGDVKYLAPGWDFVFRQGYSFSGSPWTSEIRHCWADPASLEFDITCPKGASGKLLLYLLDGDNFGGGRSETIDVSGKPAGEFSGFQAGRWVSVPIASSDSATGRIPVVVKSTNPKGNAVVTYVRFVEAADR